MKTSDEIKKGLKCFQRIKNHECNDLCIGEECDLYIGSYPITENASDALDYIKQLEARIPKWISVEERLPPYNKNVLVFRPSMAMYAVITSYDGFYGEDDEEWHEGWRDFGFNIRHEPVITHWMPLPEPPKEE